MPVHISLEVNDVDESKGFYARWLDFGPEDRRFPDGTVFIRDPEGTDLALHAGTRAAPTTSFHFGFRRATSEEVRGLRDRLADAAVDGVEFDDDPDVVSVKFKDPNGYVIEVYWEPDAT